MVKEAQDVVRRGELGQILKVITEYPQGWQLNPLEATDKDHAWRNDSSKAGATGCLGDIGTHVEHLSRYITGLAFEAETSGKNIPESCDFPCVEDGVAGMAFVEAAVESATNGGAWTKMKRLS
jgi:predicted dehydrogenase